MEIVLDRDTAFAFPEGLLQSEGVVEEVAGVVVVVPAEVGTAEVERVQIGEALINPADTHDFAEIARVQTLWSTPITSYIVFVDSA